MRIDMLGPPICGPDGRMKTTVSRISGAVALVFCVVVAFAAMAEAASDWADSRYAKTRLIPGASQSDSAGSTIRAGVQVKLADGWKTYWRNPGDSGIPASFDFSGSKNLKSADVLWPAPHRFKDSYGTSIGYAKEVVFPVLISPEKADQPVDIDLKLDYAVCKDICVPAEAQLKMTLRPGKDQNTALYDSVIARYLAKVPVDGGAENSENPTVRKASAKLDGTAPVIEVDAHFPSGTEGADLFAEGPEGLYIPPPQGRAVGDGGNVRFTIDLGKSADGQELKGKTLKLTLVSDGGQSETDWKVE